MFSKYLTKSGNLSPQQPSAIKTAWYILRFIEVHGNKYDYSLVSYVASDVKVSITCPEHGVFEQRPNDHLKGYGCKDCGKTAKLTKEVFIEKAKKVHGGRYLYNNVVYSTNKEKTLITCKIHGDFPQRPNDHLNGQGCPLCAGRVLNILYVLQCKSTGLIKIGVTGNLKNRVKSLGIDLSILGSVNVPNATAHEKYLHEKYAQYQEYHPCVRSGGSEFFQLPDISILELLKYVGSL